MSAGESGCVTDQPSQKEGAATLRMLIVSAANLAGCGAGRRPTAARVAVRGESHWVFPEWSHSGTEHPAFWNAFLTVALIASAASVRVCEGRAVRSVDNASAALPLTTALKYQDVSLARLSEYGSLPVSSHRSEVYDTPVSASTRRNDVAATRSRTASRSTSIGTTTPPESIDGPGLRVHSLASYSELFVRMYTGDLSSLRFWWQRFDEAALFWLPAKAE